MADEDDIQLEHLAAAHEFRLSAPYDGAVVRYNDTKPGIRDLFSTFVPTDLRGEGVAGRLVKGVLDHARAHDLKVVPSCWYVARYIDNHPEYSDLVA